MNSMIAAFREARAALSGIAEEAGLNAEAGIVETAKRFRQGRATKK